MDNTPDDATSSPDSNRPRRAPPTIDLEASEVSEQGAGAGAGKSGRAKWSFAALPKPSLAAMAPFLAAGVSGAVAAALVIGCAWIFGWFGDNAPPSAQTDANASAIAGLSSRLNALEARPSLSLNSDSSLPARLETLEKSIVALRTELANTRTRADKLAAELATAKSAPVSPASAPDISAIEERLAQLERASRADSDKIAQNANRPADDTALRRLVVAAMLNLSVRQQEPFTATLAAAKALTSDADALKPLENFASSGVPNPASLTRELLTLVPKLSPPAPAETSTTGTGVIDRLKAGAAKLVRIERTDATGNDRGAIVARITAAAVRNDLSDARREVEQLSPSDREPAQKWLDKVKEREAALAAAHHFVTEAMAALAKPGP